MGDGQKEPGREVLVRMRNLYLCILSLIYKLVVRIGFYCNFTHTHTHIYNDIFFFILLTFTLSKIRRMSCNKRIIIC